MARKKKTKEEEFISWIVILSVFVVSIIGWLQGHLLIGSFLIGLSLSFIPILVLLFIRGQRIKRSQILARNSLYDDYTPQEFENATAEIFRRTGFRSDVTSYSGDQGIDIVLSKNDTTIGVQCKRYRPDKKIGPAFIREFAGSLDGSNLQEGIFVTTSNFTPAARQAAKDSQYRIRLMNGNQLADLKNKVEGKVNTDLIQVKWWGGMKRWQRNFLLIMYNLGFTTMYMGIAYFLITS